MALSGGGFGRGRRLAGLAEGLGTAVVVLLLVGALTYAASRPALRQRWDLTADERFSLTEVTRQVLAGLPSPVAVTTVFRPEVQVFPNGLREVQVRAAEYVRNLLQEYVLASRGKLVVRHLDVADLAEAEELVQRHGLSRYNVVLLTRGEQERQVYLEELVTIDRGLADPERIEPAQLRALHAEQPLTSALLSLTSDEAPRVGFVTGHGEPDLEDFDLLGLGPLAQALRGQGLAVEPVDLIGGAVPDELDLLALVGPQRGLAEHTVDKILAFHEGGGALLLALDPLVGGDPLERLLERLGVIRERAILVQPRPLVQGPDGAVLFVRKWFGEHPVSAPIARQGIVAVMALAGGLARHPAAPVDVAVVNLALAEQVFADQPLGPESPGNWEQDGGEAFVNRAVAVAVEGGPARAVVFGGSRFLTASFLDATQGGPGNMDLALNAANWLTRREYAVGARPREVFESRVELYPEEVGDVFLYVVVLLPLGGVALGVLVWFLRRR